MVYFIFLGQIITKDPNNCFGSQCSYGVVHSWEEDCYYPPNVCKGRWMNITGQCCKVCANVTTLPPETTTPQPACYLGNKRYNVGKFRYLGDVVKNFHLFLRNKLRVTKYH